MDPRSQQPKGQGGALSSLNVAIEILSLAKEVSDITPAKAAFGSVSVLLTMVRVRFSRFCDDELGVHVYPGLDDQRAGIRRAWVILRRYLSSA